MRRKILPFILGGALSIAAVAPAGAQSDPGCVADVDRGGAAALVALVQANVLAGVNVCDINILNNSLNNLLRNADIHVLENILNNSPILSHNVIVAPIANGVQINVLGGGVNAGDLVLNLTTS
jgi:hypothetical protein